MIFKNLRKIISKRNFQLKSFLANLIIFKNRNQNLKFLVSTDFFSDSLNTKLSSYCLSVAFYFILHQQPNYFHIRRKLNISPNLRIQFCAAFPIPYFAKENYFCLNSFRYCPLQLLFSVCWSICSHEISLAILSVFSFEFSIPKFLALS